MGPIAKLQQHDNDGTRDIGSAPSPLILIRHLDASITEQDIWHSLATLSLPATPLSPPIPLPLPKRILLIRARDSSQSLGFAFAEYLGTKSASQVVKALADPVSFPPSFVIGYQRPGVLVTFAHSESFPRQYTPSQYNIRMRDKSASAFTVNVKGARVAKGGTDVVDVAYWDGEAYASEYVGERPASASATVIQEQPAADQHDPELAAFYQHMVDPISVDAPVHPQSITAPSQSAVSPPSTEQEQPIMGTFQPIKLSFNTSSSPAAVSIIKSNHSGKSKFKPAFSSDDNPLAKQALDDEEEITQLPPVYVPPVLYLLFACPFYHD